MKKRLLPGIVIGLVAVNAIPVHSYELGDWVVRVGATNVSPNDASSNVFVDAEDLGVGVNVGNNTQLGLNLAYFITANWSIELLAATPFNHNLGLNTVGALGETKHLPPTLTANYYFADSSSVFQPYVGAGVNYTIFFEDKFTAANTTAGFTELNLDNSLGLSAQVGFDFVVDANWHVNASARWIDIDTEVSFKLNGASGQVDVEIDPMVYTVSLGYRF